MAPPNNTWAYGTGELEKSMVPLSGTSSHYKHPKANMYPYADYSVRIALLTDSTPTQGPFTEAIVVRQREQVPQGQPQNIQVTHPAQDPTSYPPVATQLIVWWDAPDGLWVNNTPISSFQVSASSPRHTATITEELEVEWQEDDPTNTNFSLALTKLYPHTEYTIRVASVGKGGNSKSSSAVSATTPAHIPTVAPQNVSLATRGPSSLSLRWNPIKDSHPNSNGKIIGYSINYMPIDDIHCHGVQCPKPTECQLEPRCEFGDCIYESRPNGTLCDDDNPDTENDMCVGGYCVGDDVGGHHDNVVRSRSLSMNTRSHGAGYMPFFEEYWFGWWSGSWIYRWGKDGNYITRFRGQTSTMQIWGEPDSGYYYLARWSSRRCVKVGPFTSRSTRWSFLPPGSSSVGGVCTDDKYAYCMQTRSETVYVLDKNTGQQVNTITLTGGTTGNLYGSFFVVGDKIYYGTGRRFYRHNLEDGRHDGFSFEVGLSITNSFFTGQDICVSSGSSTIYCYRVSPCDRCLLFFVNVLSVHSLTAWLFSLSLVKVHTHSASAMNRY